MKSGDIFWQLVAAKESFGELVGIIGIDTNPARARYLLRELAEMLESEGRYFFVHLETTRRLDRIGNMKYATALLKLRRNPKDTSIDISEYITVWRYDAEKGEVIQTTTLKSEDEADEIINKAIGEGCFVVELWDGRGVNILLLSARREVRFGLGDEDIEMLREAFKAIVERPEPEDVERLEELLERLKRELSGVERPRVLERAAEEVAKLAEEMPWYKRRGRIVGACALCRELIVVPEHKWTYWGGRYYHSECARKAGRPGAWI